MSKIKIFHTADIHIYNNSRFDEYKEQFNKLYDILKKEKPQIFCIVGDLFEMFIDISNESKIIAGTFLHTVSLYVDEIIIVPGNHDVRKRNINRINSVETIVKLIENPKVVYLEKSGFFQDNVFPEIVWVNWFHTEKHINPWNDIPHKRDKNKVYIDLFHDPINGAVNDLGFVFDNKRLVSDFKGEISMFGDLHKSYQILDTNKVYPGSLIQQNFGEPETGHGLISWEINDKKITHTFLELPNNYALVNFKLDTPANYDTLDLTSPYVVEHNKFRVVWSDHSANINRENELKIRRHLKKLYNVDDIRFQKFPYHVNIENTKLISEILNINDIQVQQNIIREYLTNNKYNEDFINEILKIDNVINSRIEINTFMNILWNIDKITFNNFKSYGDDNILDLNTIDGIVQINGINQMGKTTLIDVICYVLYGKTTSTVKREKFGDNRFINNKRNLNYCDASIVIDINGDKYFIYRKTERKVNSKGEITACSTNVDYYLGTEKIETNKLTDETGKKTQKYIQEVLGDFDDFVRLALTNGDNLNSLLSIDRSEFVDSIIKDAGYEIFDKKLEEFKLYKKEQNFEKIVLDPLVTDNKIAEYKEQIKKTVAEEQEIDLNITEVTDKINKGLSIQESLTLKLHKIDESIINLNIDDIFENITETNNKIASNDAIIVEYTNIIEKLPVDFDYHSYNEYVDNKSKYEKDLHKLEIENIEIGRKIDEYKFKIDNVDVEIEYVKKEAINKKNIEINKLNNNINLEKNNINISVNQKTKEFDNKINILLNSIGKIDNELHQLKQDGLKYSSELKTYQSTIEDDAKCPTCGQSLSNCDPEHLNNLINEKHNQIKLISEEARVKLLNKKELNLGVEKYNQEKEQFSDIGYLKNNFPEIAETYDKIDNLNAQINKITDSIKNFNVDEIKNEISNIFSEKKKAEMEIDEYKSRIDNNLININTLSANISNIDKILDEKLIIKKNVEVRKDYVIKINDFIQKNTELDKNIIKKQQLIDEYNKNLKQIEENKIFNERIIQSKNILNHLNDKKTELFENKLSLNNTLTLTKKIMADLIERQNKYIEQIKREEIYSTYMSIMSRNGLATFLLKKNIDLLNNELSTLLSNLNFSMFFDDELVYKLEHNGLQGIENAIESSGKERTFAALALKVVLRSINFKSKPLFMFLDEGMGKLVENSVEEFIEFINVLKTKFDKIFIIEHNNDVLADVIINVKKSNEGISSFEII
jgi:DNA repair exonuclease SbcCD ATPase subunit